MNQWELQHGKWAYLYRPVKLGQYALKIYFEMTKGVFFLFKKDEVHFVCIQLTLRLNFKYTRTLNVHIYIGINLIFCNMTENFIIKFQISLTYL